MPNNFQSMDRETQCQEGDVAYRNAAKVAVPGGCREAKRRLSRLAPQFLPGHLRQTVERAAKILESRSPTVGTVGRKRLTLFAPVHACCELR